MFDSDFPEPERLRAFVAVAETGSFSRAAERLRLAQPTISIQVRRLEESVGRPLLIRKATFAHLTSDGEALLGYAREILEVVGRARRQFAQPSLEGSVRLGVVEDFNYAAFPEMLGGLRRRHSRFELYVISASAADLFAQLRTNALDMVLTKGVPGSTGGEPLCRQKMAWVGHPWVLQQEGDIIPLAVTPPNSVTREIILRALRTTGKRWSVRLEAPSLSGLHAAVLAGIGVTAFGVGMIPPDLIQLTGLELPPLEETEFALGVNPTSNDPVVAAFADVVRTIVPMIIARLEEEQATALR